MKLKTALVCIGFTFMHCCAAEEPVSALREKLTSTDTPTLEDVGLLGEILQYSGVRISDEDAEDNAKAMVLFMESKMPTDNDTLMALTSDDDERTNIENAFVGFIEDNEKVDVHKKVAALLAAHIIERSLLYGEVGVKMSAHLALRSGDEGIQEDVRSKIETFVSKADKEACFEDDCIETILSDKGIRTKAFLLAVRDFYKEPYVVEYC